MLNNHIYELVNARADDALDQIKLLSPLNSARNFREKSKKRPRHNAVNPVHPMQIQKSKISRFQMDISASI